MERVELPANSRDVLGKKVKQLRAQGLIPAVLYGPDLPPRPIQAEERPFVAVIREAGSTSLIDLTVDGEAEAYVVLARQVQINPITGRLLHADFYQVRLTEKVKISPRLEFVGESPAVKAGSAVLITSMMEVEVECLPTDLIDSIEVNLTGLEELGDSIQVRELQVPTGVSILADEGQTVVSLVAPRAALAEAMEEELAEGELLEGEEAEEETAEDED
jgi:large subunit ribosomal protein L25